MMSSPPAEWYIPVDERLVSAGVVYPGPRVIEAALTGQAAALRAAALAAYEARSELAPDIAFSHEGALYRCHRRGSVQGDWLILRQVPAAIPPLPEQVREATLRKWILARRLNDGGLIIVSGKAGAGKTTTAASIVSARLRAYHGVCHAIEKPAEYALQGRHGQGFCLQTSVFNNRDMAAAIDDALRCYPVGVPSLMLIGEIKTAAELALLLNAAANSALIIITLHACSEIGALYRIQSLLPPDRPAESLALLANTLRLILHQEIVNERLYIHPLVMTDRVRVKLREGNFDSLREEVSYQHKKIKADALQPSWGVME